MPWGQVNVLVLVSGRNTEQVLLARPACQKSNSFPAECVLPGGP